jgi:hypothetical protein
MNVLRCALAAVVCLALGGAARADEEKVPLDKLPAKVKEAVKAKFPDAELVSAEKEKKDGKVAYEVNIKNQGQTIEVTVGEDGKIVSIEKEITVKDLPKPVAEAFEKKYPKATVSKVEEVTEGEKTKFELLIMFGTKKLEVCFDPTGKFLEEEDKSKEKDEKK